MNKKKKIFYDKSKIIGEIIISKNNRITYVYRQNLTGKVIEIVNVSYDIYFQDCWITILRYDNYHGYLHKHALIFLDENSETLNIIGVRQKGSNKRLLRWAIDDIKLNYDVYKRKIIKRTNNKLNKKIDIDFY